jgi:Flp pilus assembly protein TadG
MSAHLGPPATSLLRRPRIRACPLGAFAAWVALCRADRSPLPRGSRLAAWLAPIGPNPATFTTFHAAKQDPRGNPPSPTRQGATTRAAERDPRGKPPPSARQRRAIRAAKNLHVPERGSITVWLLGLAVLVLFVGGLSLDLWRAFSARQLLANAADAAAVAGATGIDTARFRDTGQLALDPPLAMQRAGDSLAHQGGLPLVTPPGVEVTPDPPQVVVVLTGQVRLTLMRVLLPNQAPLTIRVRAASVPREIP